MTLDPARPCPYCIGYEDDPDKPGRVVEVLPDGSRYRGLLSEPHPECLASVAEYEAERESYCPRSTHGAPCEKAAGHHGNCIARHADGIYEWNDDDPDLGRIPTAFIPLAAEPVVCTCPTPDRDPIGECRQCRRPVVDEAFLASAAAGGAMVTAEHLQPTESDRGFMALPKIAGDYGGAVSVRESSSAEAPKLWLTVVELDDLCGPPDGPTHVATIHLTAEDAWKLADQLRCAVRNHYHGDATPEWADGGAS